MSNGNRTIIDLPQMPKMPKLPAGALKLILPVVILIFLVFSSFYQVDPEEVTRRGFEAQARKLSEIVEGKTEDEVAQILEGRLGPGQARVVAARVMSSKAQ